MQARAPHATGALAHLTNELSVAAQSLAGACELDQPGGLMGRISEHRAWALCSLNFDKAPLALLESIGFEIGRAYLTQDVFLRGPAADLYRLQEKSIKEELSQEELDWVENYALSLAQRTQPVFADRTAGLDASTSAFNAQVVASICAQTSSLRVEQRQAAGRIIELTELELKGVAPELKKRAPAQTSCSGYFFLLAQRHAIYAEWSGAVCGNDQHPARH